MVALEAGSALESGAGFLHSQPARQAKGAFDAETEERPRNVAQHWLTGWLCYIGLFNAVLSATWQAPIALHRSWTVLSESH